MDLETFQLVELDYGNLILGQFFASAMPQMSRKMILALKVVKIN
jgi:hypothetical protein